MFFHFHFHLFPKFMRLNTEVAPCIVLVLLQYIVYFFNISVKTNSIDLHTNDETSDTTVRNFNCLFPSATGNFIIPSSHSINKCFKQKTEFELGILTYKVFLSFILRGLSCTVYSWYCTLYNWYCTLQLVVYTLQLVLYSVQLILYSVQLVVYSVQLVLYSVQLVLYTV